jgi:hypothetical protein
MNVREAQFCDILIVTCSQVADSKHGEMAEWLKEHAWKSTPVARADAHQIPATHFRFNDFRNIDAR